MDAFTFLDKLAKCERRPAYVVHGDEDLLKRQVRTGLRKLVLGDEDDALGLSTHAGDKTTFAAIHDELRTLPFLSSSRMVIVDNADPFVTKYRANLEKYVAEPAATGSLVLDVKAWPSNTRLAKLLDDASTIVCKAPPAYKLPDWCVKWASSQYGKQLPQPAAKMLVDLVGSDMGFLDQELNKLSLYVGSAAKITEADIDKLVGRSREENIWKIFDAIGGGQVGQALSMLDQLLDQGEDEMGVLAVLSMQLRRLAQAARYAQEGTPVSAALAKVGTPPFAISGTEQQLRHLGRQRANKLFDWLLETDLGMKGSCALPKSTQLERLVIRLARKN